MNANSRRGRIVGAMLCALLSIPTVQAADASAAGGPPGDRAACDSGQDPAACAREAGAAQAEAKRGGLTDPAQAERQRNATTRCNALPQADQPDCLARARGEGTASGSVSTGGIYRETVTRVPAPPGSSPSAPDGSR